MSDIYILQKPPRQEIMHIWDKKKPRSGEVIDRADSKAFVRWASQDQEWVSLIEKVTLKGRRVDRYEVSDSDE